VHLSAAALKSRAVLVVCLVGMCATTFTTTVLTVSLRDVARDLDSSPAVVAWAVTGSVLAQAVATPIFGRVGDIRGHRKTFLIGFCVAIVFSLLTALAWSAPSLIAFRVLAQLGGTATVPASFAMLFRVFPPAERARPAAWAVGSLAASSVCGLAIGGLIIDAVSWRPLFVMQAGLCVVAVVPAVRILPRDPERVRVPFDKGGAVVLAAAAFALTFGVNRATVWGTHPVVLLLALALPPLVLLFVAIERRASHPVLPLHLLARRDVRVGGGVSFLVGAAHMGNFLITPLLLQGVFGLSIAKTSLVTMARTLAIPLSAPSASRLGRRYGSRALVTAATGSYMAALVGLGLGAKAGALGVVLVALVLSGSSFGHAQPPLLTMAANAVPPGHFGLATSLQQTASQIGAVVGMSLLSAVVGASTNAGPFVAAYFIGAAAVGLACVVAGACANSPVREPGSLERAVSASVIEA
jgi:MFS family permease